MFGYLMKFYPTRQFEKSCGGSESLNFAFDNKLFSFVNRDAIHEVDYCLAYHQKWVEVNERREGEVVRVFLIP